METQRIQLPAVLDGRTTERLAGDLERAAAGPGGVIVLAGADGTFCRGIDFATLASAEEAGTLKDECRRSVAAYVLCAGVIRACGKPVVAAVDGEVLGGGVGLAAACDLVVATDRSTFGLPEALFGLIPAIAVPLLLERMPPQKVRLLALTAGSFGAAEARAMGLVDVLTPVDALDGTVGTHVRALRRPPSGAVAGLKRLTGGPARGNWRVALEEGAELTRSLLESEEVGRAVREFVSAGRVPWGTA